MEHERQDQPPRRSEFDLWTEEGLRAAYGWLMSEEPNLGKAGSTGFEPLTDTELEAMLERIKRMELSPLPSEIERLGDPFRFLG